MKLIIISLTSLLLVASVMVGCSSYQRDVASNPVWSHAPEKFNDFYDGAK